MLPPIASLKARRGAGGLQLTGAPDRTPVLAQITTHLNAFARSAEPTRDVQLVVQVCGAEGYRPWRTTRELLWRREGGRYGTASWPAGLVAEALAGVLLPLPAGPADEGRRPRVIADPLFSTGTPPRGGGPDELALGLVATWMARHDPARPVRLAAPVLELVGPAGRVTERRTLDAGLTWPLAA